MFTHIIFDMDGVIINSEPIHQKIELQMMADRGVTIDDAEFKQFVGMAGYDMWQILKDRYSLPETVDDLRAEKRERLVEFLDTLDDSVLVPGAVDCIRSFREAGTNLAVASSSGRWYVERILEHFELDRFFRVVVTGWDVRQSKPAPDIFLLAAEKLGAEPKSCIVIEDSENGVNAAIAAGMRVVGYQNPDSILQDLSKADWLIQDFSEIDHHLREVFNEGGVQ